MNFKLFFGYNNSFLTKSLFPNSCQQQFLINFHPDSSNLYIIYIYKLYNILIYYLLIYFNNASISEFFQFENSISFERLKHLPLFFDPNFNFSIELIGLVERKAYSVLNL